MQLLLDGNPFFPGTVTIRESVFEYSTVLTFNSIMPLIFEEITLQISENIPYVPVMIEQLDMSSFQYTCYPKSYVDFLHFIYGVTTIFHFLAISFKLSTEIYPFY